MSRIQLKSVSTSNNNEDDGNQPTRKRLKIETEPKIGSTKLKLGKMKLWEGFVIFSQFEASSLERNRLNGWSEIDATRLNGWNNFFATSSWNPYSATMKQVAMYLHVLESKHKLSNEERFFCVDQILQYIPHLKDEEMPKFEIENYPDEIEIIFSAINKDETTKINQGQVTLTNTYKKSLRYNGAIWEDFVSYCSKLQEDPFLAQPHHIRQFIEQVFEEEAKSKFQNNFSSSLENYSSFYCANVVNICKHLGFYLKFEYEGGSLLASDPIKTLLSLFHCLDKKLVHPTGKVSKDDSNLMKRLIPKYWYANNQGSDFWKEKLVSEILMDVKNGVLTKSEAAWELGVTPDMLACGANRMEETYVSSEPRQKSSRIKILEEKKAKIRQEASVDADMEEDTQNLSLTVKEYVEKGFGSEESFWKETSTEMLVDDVRNRVLDLDVAAFQLGTSSAKILEKVGKIKTAFEIHQEENRIREEKKKENKANATPKLTPLEYKIQLGEKNEANLSEYEKMRLSNMRDRLSFLSNLEIETDKKALKASIPVKPSSSKVFIEPRKKSSRIKVLEEKRDKIHQEIPVDVEMDQLSPEWVAKRTPRSSTYLMTDPTSQVSWKIIEENSENLSLEELSSKIPVPKLTIAAEDLISRDSNYHKSTQFMQRLESEVKLRGNEIKGGKITDISKWIQAGTGKVTNEEILSLAISEELIACGDAGGGLGFWLGERSLLLRPHHRPVCRTVFLGTGTNTSIATASHDGTVRVYDVSSQTFQLGFSWNKVYKHQQGVVWMEPVDESTWLLNCEGGDVLNVDKRDRKVAKLLCLPKARRSCQPQILASKAMFQNKRHSGTPDWQISATPALVGCSISIHPVDRNLISLCDDETVVIYDRRNCGQPMFTIGTINKFKNTSWNSTLNHHCGSGWNPTGKFFATYQRSDWSPSKSSSSLLRSKAKILQGSVNLYSHSQLRGGDDLKSDSLTNSKYEPVFSRGQGIVWSPWQDDVYYFVANTKPLLTNNYSNSVVAGVDINSDAVVEEVFLSTSPPSLVGFHPTRPQFVLANLNETGDVVIYKEEQTLMK